MAGVDLDAARAQAHACALEMKLNVDYVLGELANVTLPAELAARVEAVWGEISGTGHDVMSELFELDEVTDDDAIAKRLARSRRWIRDDLAKLHEVIQAVDVAAQADTAVQGAFILPAESATNILNPLKCLNEVLANDA